MDKLVGLLHKYGIRVNVCNVSSDLGLIESLEADGFEVYDDNRDNKLVDIVITADDVVNDHSWQTTIRLTPLSESSDSNTNDLNVWDGNTLTHYPETVINIKDDAWYDRYNRDIVDKVLDVWPELEPYLDDIIFFHAGLAEGYSIYDEPFTGLLSRVIDCAKTGKRIIFDNSDETITLPVVMKLQRIVERVHMELENPPKFYLLTAALSAPERYLEFCESRGLVPLLTMLPVNMFEHNVKTHVDGVIKELSEQVYTPEIKEKNFVCFNRVPRRHRVELFAKLMERDLVDGSYYSFDISDADEKVDWQDFLTPSTYNTFNKCRPLLPLVLNRTELRDNPVELCVDDIRYHKNSYFSVVTETVFYQQNSSYYDPLHGMDSVFLSEKVFKPLAYMHPFIMASVPGTMAKIRELGYRTFHPYIDERYDSISDDEERLAEIVRVINRLCSNTPEQWLAWQRNVRPIVEHNISHFLKEKRMSTIHDIIELIDD